MTLSAAEHALTLSDKCLPGLPLVLDPPALKKRIGIDAGNPFDFTVRHYIRYKFATNCLVAYSGDAGDSRTTVYAKAYGTDFDQKVQKLGLRSENGWDVPAATGGMWALPEERIVVRRFPADTKLRSLRLLDDPEARRRLLRRLLRHRSSLWDGRIIELAYKPERRYVARISGEEAEQAIVKFYGSHAFVRSCCNVEHLQRIGYTRLPRAIGRCARRQALAFDWSEGLGLRESAGNGTLSTGDARALGLALATLHDRPPGPRLHRWRFDAERKRLRALTKTLTRLVPALASDVQSLHRSIVERIGERHFTPTLIHGDFHSKQILLDGGEVRFLDLDELATGPAQLDLGTFVAHLHRDALRGFLPAALARSISEAFIEGYRSAAGDVRELDAFVALALLKFSHHPFRACEPEWENGIAAIVGLALAILNRDGSFENRASVEL